MYCSLAASEVVWVGVTFKDVGRVLVHLDPVHAVLDVQRLLPVLVHTFSSLRYYNSRTEVGKLLAHSGGPESPWGVGPALVTKDNLAARLHAFEPRYVIAIHTNTSQYVVILIGIHTNTSGYIRQIIDTPSIHDGYLYDT